MQFAPPPRRALVENLLPMINVIFLLLVFFLIAARLAPPSPFTLAPPEAAAQAAGAEPAPLPEGGPGRLVLWLSATGEMAAQDATGQWQRGEAGALAALGAARQACLAGRAVEEACGRLTLRLDGAAPAPALVALVPKLADLGFARLALVARQTGAPPSGSGAGKGG